MSVFRGSPWQDGYGRQVGFGLGGLFRSIGRAVMPLVKTGARTLGNVALNSGANFLGDVLSGKNVKESARSRVNEAANIVKRKTVNKLQTLAQTGNGKRRKLERRRPPLQQSEGDKPRNEKQLSFRTYLIKSSISYTPSRKNERKANLIYFQCLQPRSA